MELRAYGGTMRLGGWDCKLKKGTKVWDIYGKSGTMVDPQKGIASERHRHRYEFNDEFTEAFEQAGMTFSARSVKEGLAEYIELPEETHPFFVATQGHPEYKSRPLQPHPLFVSFFEAMRK